MENNTRNNNSGDDRTSTLPSATSSLGFQPSRRLPFNSSSFDEFIQLKPTSYGNGFVPIYDYQMANYKTSRENRLKFLRHESLAHQTDEIYNSLAKDSYLSFPRHRPRKPPPNTFSHLRMEGLGQFVSETRSQYGSPLDSENHFARMNDVRLADSSMKLFHLGNSSTNSNSSAEIRMVESADSANDSAAKSSPNSGSEVGDAKGPYYKSTIVTTHQ